MNLKVIVGMLVICCRAETQQRARIVWICFQLLPWASSLLFSSSLLSSSLLVLYSLFTYLAFAVETRAIVAAPCLNIFGYAVAVPANLLLLRLHRCPCHSRVHLHAGRLVTVCVCLCVANALWFSHSPALRAPSHWPFRFSIVPGRRRVGRFLLSKAYRRVCTFSLILSA